MRVSFFIAFILTSLLFMGLDSFSQGTDPPLIKEEAEKKGPSTNKVPETKKEEVVTEEEQKQEAISFENYLQRLTGIPNIMDRRDPFETQPHPYLKKFSHIEKGKPSGPIPPLQRFPVKNYVVKAILLGQGSPKALISIPDDNKKTWIVKVGTLFGNRGGKINVIDKEGLRVMEEVINSEGDRDKIEVELEVSKKKKG